MSRGPGHVERKLGDVFARAPQSVFTTDVLCRRVYRVKEVEKRHRVAVLRALKRLAARSMPTLWRESSSMNAMTLGTIFDRCQGGPLTGARKPVLRPVGIFGREHPPEIEQVRPRSERMVRQVEASS